MSLDWQIYCQLYRQTAYPSWGLFPHPPVSEIARSLGLARGTVSRRLIGLERAGFLSGYDVIPNPTLLGVGLCSNIVTIPAPDERLRFLDELESVDGVLAALVNFGGNVNLLSVSDLPASRSRREGMLRKIDGVEAVSRGSAVWLPTCTRSVTIDDWRLIGMLRRNPKWTLKSLADELEISTKTAGKRLHLLKIGRAILGYAIENFANFPGVVVGRRLILSPGTDSRSVAMAAQRLLPDALEVKSTIRAPGAPSTSVTFIRMVQTASESDAIRTLRIPGVARIETFFPGTSRPYGHWFNARIFELIARHAI